MRVGIFSNNVRRSLEVKAALTRRFLERHFIIDDENPEVVVTIGGDGTLLSAFHKYIDMLDKIRFVGVHTGHLGFYTDWRDDEIDDLVISLQSDNGQSVSYPLLDVFVTYKDSNKRDVFTALNEATIRRISSTMVTDVFIGGEFFERFRGDGLCVSTPTGSTAYNKSLGGAVLHPTIEALQLTEIASLNNRVYRTLGSPLIVPKHEKITVYPTRMGSYTLSVDNKTYTNRNVKKVEFSIDQRKISFVASASHTSFWERVRDSFIGDMEE